MNQLKAFHGKQEIKEKYLKRVLAHQKADEIIQGKYWENGKGCAVGCTIQGNDHLKYEIELGIPKEIAYLEDVIFEELKGKKSKEFPARFLKSVKVGADLSKVIPQFVIWQFEDKKYGLKNIKEVQDDKEVYDFCEEVVGLYKRVEKGEQVSEDEFYQLYLKIDTARAWAWGWAGARARAWTGARAWARAWARAMAMAWTEVGTGAWARARAIAWTRAWARAMTWTGAWAMADYDKYINIMADKFIELIENSPVK